MNSIQTWFCRVIFKTTGKDSWQIYVSCTHRVYLSAELASSFSLLNYSLSGMLACQQGRQSNWFVHSDQGELEWGWGLGNWPNAMHWVGRNARLSLSTVGRSSVPCSSVWCLEELACGDGSWVEQLKILSHMLIHVEWRSSVGLFHLCTKQLFQDVLE